MNLKKCFCCGEEKPLEKFYRNPDGSIRKHRCIACYGKRDRAKLKLEAIITFGGKCQCCGEDHPYFLSLDHINNDGAKAREQYNEQQIYREARREGWPKEKYQLLCMNCNFAKGHFKECPHKLGISAERALIDLRKLAYNTVGRDLVVEDKTGLELGPLAKMLKSFSKEQIEEMLKKLK